jgi:hypothetical protein
MILFWNITEKSLLSINSEFINTKIDGKLFILLIVNQ